MNHLFLMVLYLRENYGGLGRRLMKEMTILRQEFITMLMNVRVTVVGEYGWLYLAVIPVVKSKNF